MENDLFSQNFTQGNMASIETISGYVGEVMVFIISLVGFMIVMVSILKNALAGLYATNPNLWEKVNDVKQQKIQLEFGKNVQGNQVTALLGTATMILLSLLPNIKVMTDFEDIPADPKPYFMKAIPLMVVQIFIGVFIFFGYPAKVADKLSEFGTGMFDVFLDNVDPVAWTQSLPDKMVILSYSTDGSEDEVDMAVNKVAREATTTLIGKLDKMTKEKRLEMALEVERWVITELENRVDSKYFNTDQYTMSVNARIELSPPDLSRVNGGDSSPGKLNSDGSYTLARYKTINSFQHGVPNVDDNWCLRFDVTFDTKASKGNINHLNVTMSGCGYEGNGSGKTFKIHYNTSGISGAKVAGDGAEGKLIGKKSGSEIKWTVRLTTVTDSYLEFTVVDSGVNNTTGVSVEEIQIEGLLKYSHNSGGSHPIKKIKAANGNSGSAVFEADSAGFEKWNFGEVPKQIVVDYTNPAGGTN